MKNVLKIINIVFTLLSLALSLFSVVYRIILFITALELLVPFAVILCYIAFVISTLCVVLNFITYSVTKKNGLIPLALFSAFISFLIFIISLCV